MDSIGFCWYGNAAWCGNVGLEQLDLFIPKDFEYDYTVIATNKAATPGAVLAFHHGRGPQEELFGEAK